MAPKPKEKVFESKTTQKHKLLLKTDRGHIESRSRKTFNNIEQADIVKSVDITNASKHFELKLDKLGPYKCDYYKSGRFLLIAGHKGHVAAFDWLTKDLLCEFNVRESVYAIKWLHIPNMFAVAQKDWTHIYDKDGIELNVIKTMYRITHLDFLEHHFLLASASDKNYLTWKDVSIGQDIACFPTKNKITHLTHNQQNGVLVCSHHNGTVAMWTPNYNRPAVSILCHPASLRAVTVSKDGNYLATTSIDKSIKVWDLRNSYQCLKQHKLDHVPDSVDFSQLGLLAVGCGKCVNVYKDVTTTNEEMKPYLKNNLDNLVEDVHFCNFEDVLGVGHQNGFTSLLVPGSGEPNFDSHEANPFISKTQQREMEIKMLLDKIPHEMICLDPSKVVS